MRYVALMLLAAPVAAQEKRVAVAEHTRHRLLELYTSEGCSSCPPAEAWLTQAKAQLVAHDVVPLAFHVDYWDRIGWPDPFAQARFTARQEARVNRDGGHLYTPELAVDGHNAPTDELGQRLTQPQPPTSVKLTLEQNGTRLVARVTGASVPARLSLVVVESGLVVKVERGENAGKTLHHDFVVRQLFTADGNELARDVVPERQWNPKQLGYAAIAEDARTGELLQAVLLPPP